MCFYHNAPTTFRTAARTPKMPRIPGASIILSNYNTGITCSMYSAPAQLRDTSRNRGWEENLLSRKGLRTQEHANETLKSISDGFSKVTTIYSNETFFILDFRTEVPKKSVTKIFESTTSTIFTYRRKLGRGIRKVCRHSLENF